MPNTTNATSKEHEGAIFLTKKKVARSQLETAIYLWFHYADPASIHTLAVAAHDCLHALGKACGKSTAMKDRMKGLNKTQRDRMTAAQNFFKHGDKELNKFLRYKPEHAAVLMFDAVVAVWEIFDNPSPIMSVFLAYYCMSHPDEGFDIDSLYPAELRERLGFGKGREVDRKEFFELFVDLGLAGSAQGEFPQQYRPS
jgi:hypothetical protein